MKYDGVIILNAIGNLGIFAAGAAMMVKAWIIFVISLIIFLGATMAHAWYLANLRQQVKKEVEKEEQTNWGWEEILAISQGTWLRASKESQNPLLM